MQALRSLAGISARESVGLHQVDFRDHRDFSRPLEYLLLDEFSFHELLQGCHAECGNRVRPDAMEAMFREAGFRSSVFHPNMWAEQAYLSEFLPRLRAARATRTPASTKAFSKWLAAGLWYAAALSARARSDRQGPGVLRQARFLAHRAPGSGKSFWLRPPAFSRRTPGAQLLVGGGGFPGLRQASRAAAGSRRQRRAADHGGPSGSSTKL